MRDPFSSPKSRLNRAREHIEGLHATTEKFFRDKPYKLVIEKNTDGCLEVHKIQFTAQLPEKAVHAAAEALEALRSALDQAAYSAAAAAGNTRLRKTQFPISASEPELNNLIDGMKVCADIPPDIVKLFRSFKPFKDGNDPIYTLNKLRNATHTALISVVADYNSVGINSLRATGHTEFGFADSYNENENSIIVGKVYYPGGSLHYQANFNMHFSLKGADPRTSRRPAVDVLREMAREVARILTATEDECRRLGFVA